jgi:hypothetical protein
VIEDLQDMPFIRAAPLPTLFSDDDND